MREAADPGIERALIQNGLAMAPVFAQWGREQIDHIAQRAELRRYKRGDTVVTGHGPQRQALMVVSGLLEVSRVSDGGRRFIVGIIGAGRTTGLIRLIGDLEIDYGYTAWESAVVIHFFCDDVLAVLDGDPARWRGFMKELLIRHNEQVGTLIDQVRGPPELRIAATLRRLSILFGVPDGDGVRLRLRLTQDDLADMLCISRQTANKELRRLEESGVITSIYKTLTVLDSEALDRIVRGGG